MILSSHAVTSWKPILAILAILAGHAYAGPESSDPAAGQGPSPPWPMTRRTPGLTGHTPQAAPTELKRLWRFSSGSAIATPPVSDGTRIYVANDAATVFALDLEGTTLWTRTITPVAPANTAMPTATIEIRAPLALVDGLLLAADVDGRVLALDPMTGAIRWHCETGAAIQGTPNRIEPNPGPGRPVVIVLSQPDGVIHAIELGAGTTRWKTKATARADGSAAVADGRIAFGSCDSAIHVFSATDGASLGRVELGADRQVAAGIAMIGDRAFAGNRAGELVCIDVKKLTIVWCTKLGSAEVFTTPAVAEQTVVAIDEDGVIHALNRADGTRLWHVEVGGRAAAPIIAANRVIAAVDGALHILDLADGTRRAALRVSDAVTAPILVNNMILVGADDGTLTAFGMK